MGSFRYLCIVIFIALAGKGSVSAQDLPPGWDFTITNLFHPIAIPLSANPSLFDEPILPGDYIGVFFIRNDSLICGGASEWLGTENIAVVAFGNDNLTPIKDGFYTNEPINWKIYSYSYQTDFIATATYDPSMPNSNGKFYPGGLSALLSLEHGTALTVSASALPDTLCIGTSTQLQATAAGGTESYTYSWTSVPEGFFSNDPDPVATPSQTTSYIIHVDDAFNSVSDTVTVTVVPLPEVWAGEDTLICENGIAGLTGYAVDYLYIRWSSDGDGTFGDPSALVTEYIPGPDDKEDGLVKITLKTFAVPPCQDSVADMLFVTLDPLPVVEAGADHAICAGTSYTCSGAAVYVSTIEWSSSGDGFFDNPLYLGATYFPGNNDIEAGRADLILAGYPMIPCTDIISDTLVLTIHPLPEVSAGVDHWIPYGTSTQLNGTVTGGSGEYLYSWYPAEYLQDPYLEDPMTTNLYQSTEFVLTGSDALTSCYQTDTTIVYITGGPLSVIASATPEAVCQGSSSQLEALPSGGSGNYSYVWTSEPPGFYSTQQNPLAYPEQTTIYSVTINDGFNTASDEVGVTVYGVPDAYTGEDQTIPFGTSTTLEGGATGGSGEYTYLWSPAQYLVDPTNQNPATINLTQSVEFKLLVTDIHSQCEDTDSVTVLIVGGPLHVTVTAVPDEICQGESSQLHALASGGSGNYTYVWTSEPPGFFSDLPDPVVSPGQCTDYFVEVSDGFNTKSGYTSVEVFPLPEVEIEIFPDDTVCAGEIIRLDASTQGGIGYSWLPGGQSGPVIEVDSTGIGFGSAVFTVYVTTLDGCTGVDSVVVTFVDCVGIQEEPFLNVRLSIFPNPASDRITIRLVYPSSSPGLNPSIHSISMEIVGITGRVYLKAGLNPRDLDHSFSLSYLPRGLYFIILRNNGLILTTSKIQVL